MNEFIEQLVNTQTRFLIYNEQYGRYVFVSDDKSKGDNIAEAHPYPDEARNLFVLQNAGCEQYKFYNPEYDKYLFVSNDKKGKDHVIEARNDPTLDRNAFQLQEIEENAFKLFSPTYGEFAFVSNDTNKGDNIVESHPHDEFRNIFSFIVPVASAESVDTQFNPCIHGYKFRNLFQLKPELFGMSLGSWDMGFCGGMSEGARLCFKSQGMAPADTSPPEDGTPLFHELLNLQISKLSPETIRRVYDWQSAPDISSVLRKHSVGFRTRQEWPILKSQLDAGEPTVVLLIRVEGYSANLTKNHQVLAIGYTYNNATKDLVIRTYDPNRPGEVSTLSLNFGAHDYNLHGVDSSGERFRGFFVN